MYCKYVVSGGIVEVWKYEVLNVWSGGLHEGDGEDAEHNYRNRNRERRNRIRQLVCSNFDSTSKFVTLTFDNVRDFDIRDVKACNSYFRKFVLRLKYRFPDLKYVAVIEFQDSKGRGAVHYHMICNLPFMKKSELQRIWSGGFVKVNAIDKVDNVGAYVIKYMTKDTEDKRLCGLHAYLHSRNLLEPVEVKSWSDDSSLVLDIQRVIESMKPSYCAKYESSKAGLIEYYQYNSNRA